MSRRQLIEAVTVTVGSANEARWIVEHVEALLAEGSAPDRSAPPDLVAPHRSAPPVRATPDEAQVADQASALARRRAAGEPLQYVLGRWPFRTLELGVDRRALVPRPETEQVVEVALVELARSGSVRTARTGGRPAGTCVDLGTGSGAIALALAVEADGAWAALTVWATDRSGDALALAAANLQAVRATGGLVGHGRTAEVHLVPGTWFDALDPGLVGQVDLIVSNPPYVAESELDALPATVRNWEPRSALVARDGATGIGGLADIEAIVSGAPRWLNPTGALVVELAPAQAGPAVELARRAGFERATVRPDLAGRPRTLVAGW